jgi:propionyl-CoA carboxylase alpha chain
MISKLIAWGQDRKTAFKLLDRALDEYVINGVTHNIGFGKSILANEAFAGGNYSTAFIPTYYPKGFTGDDLTVADQSLITVVAHKLKNYFNSRGTNTYKNIDTFYVTIESLRETKAADYKVTQVSDGEFDLTDILSNKTTRHKVSKFDFSYNALVDINLDGSAQKLQYTSLANDGMKLTLAYKGNKVQLQVFDEAQYAYKKYMPPPHKVDHAKNVLSPMPGAIVRVSVQPGDKVVEGQELLVIEAMKMQNIIKSELEGEVKAVNIKGGDSVHADDILIQFK